MNTLLYVVFVGTLAAAAPSPAEAAQREPGVNARQHNQQHRMQQGVRQGDLTRGETRRLQNQARDIRREEHAFRSDGQFTRGERREVHRDLNHLSRDIYRERHDAQRRFPEHARRPHFDHRPNQGWHWGHAQRQHAWHRGYVQAHPARPHWGGHHYGPYATRQWDRRFDRIQEHQRDRIARGIRSGELTRSEARGLFAEQRAIEAKERSYLADGFLTRAERADLLEDVNAARRHIYNETHDAERRFDRAR
jgi:hypothetical protein